MKLKLKDFEGLLIDLLISIEDKSRDKDLGQILLRDFGLPRFAEYVALLLWLAATPESSKSDILRYQIKYLHDKGMFDLVDSVVEYH